ncbi:GAF domain-containing protein [Streptomyces jumonjinensis]|uniref:GAF domain-containing protein n=1 Tax=Streptomyces jumonjinensis TaxID=1945 RepID=UPI0037ADA5AF
MPDDGLPPPPLSHLHATTAARVQRLRELGLAERPDPAWDAFATGLSLRAELPCAIVNFIGGRQYFAGLHLPPDADLLMDRAMSLDEGLCPEVVDRRRPLVLADVCSAPRFAGNPVVDRLGIRTYMGAPLMDHHTGLALGTVCAVGTEPRPKSDGRGMLELIRTVREEIQQRFDEHVGFLR